MAQEVFNNYELKEYIFSFIYSLDYVLENDLVHIFKYPHFIPLSSLSDRFQTFDHKLSILVLGIIIF